MSLISRNRCWPLSSMTRTALLARSVSEVWNLMDGPESKKDQLNVFLDLHAVDEPLRRDDVGEAHYLRGVGQLSAVAENTCPLTRQHSVWLVPG